MSNADIIRNEFGGMADEEETAMKIHELAGILEKLPENTLAGIITGLVKSSMRPTTSTERIVADLALVGISVAFTAIAKRENAKRDGK